ncbi:50S ribosomal protein L11 methyltransferase [Vallitaleaceae bacterium 9-2]
MKYIEIETLVHRDDADIFCADLYDYPIQGVEILDEYISKQEQQQMFVDALDFDNTMEEYVGIRFYLSEEEDVTTILGEIKLRFPKYVFRQGKTDDEDWAHNWKKYYKPFAISQRIVVKPIWEDMNDWPMYKDTEIIIDIDPGMAFGSGTHETTSLCMKAIEKYTEHGDSFVDVGCGSGILGIAAAKLGAGVGRLIDIDASACKIAKENIASNHVEDQLTVYQGDLLENVNEHVDFVVANIFAEIIISITEKVHQVLKDQGIFIASGIIKEKEALVVSHLEAQGFEIIEINRDGGWVAIISRASVIAGKEV